jgi:acyl-CoA hydrolase
MRTAADEVRDLKFSGFVTWTGSSSMEVVVKMEGTKPTGSSSETPGDAETLMLGRFTMVCRDSQTQKARKVPRLIVETAEESTLWEIGEGKAVFCSRKDAYTDNGSPQEAENGDIDAGSRQSSGTMTLEG